MLFAAIFTDKEALASVRRGAELGQQLPVTEDVCVLRERQERLERSRSCEAFYNVQASAQRYIRNTLNSEQ